MSVVTLSAVLVAGGESRRMGRDKATIDFGGTLLWQCQLETLKKLRPLEILVSARADPPWRPAETIFVGDTEPSVGPLNGIAASLGRMRGTHLIVLAIDLPEMTAEYLQSLCDQSAPGRGIIPMIDGLAEPLAAIYPVEATGEFATALRGTDHSLQTVVRELEKTGKVCFLPVPVENRSLFRNLNSPADFDR